jgi:hypothetical protein
MKQLFFIVSLFIFSNCLFSQNTQDSPFKRVIEDTNLRSQNPFGINVLLGGPTIIISVSADFFVTQNINVEAGVGVFGFFAGGKFHFLGQQESRHWTPYVGAIGTFIPDIFNIEGEGIKGGYFPIGMHYFNESRFTFAIEVAPIIADYDDDIPVWGAIKMGYHF